MMVVSDQCENDRILFPLSTRVRLGVKWLSLPILVDVNSVCKKCSPRLSPLGVPLWLETCFLIKPAPIKIDQICHLDQAVYHKPCLLVQLYAIILFLCLTLYNTH